MTPRLPFIIIFGLLSACSSTPVVDPDPGSPADAEEHLSDAPSTDQLSDHPCGTDRWNDRPPSEISDADSRPDDS